MKKPVVVIKMDAGADADADDYREWRIYVSMVICSLAGREEVCSRCPHAVPHEARPETYLEAACVTEDLCLWTKARVNCVEVKVESESEGERRT